MTLLLRLVFWLCYGMAQSLTLLVVLHPTYVLYMALAVPVWCVTEIWGHIAYTLWPLHTRR